MHRLSWIVLAGWWLPVWPAERAQVASQPETLRNDKATVSDVVLRSGESETVPGNVPAVTVYFQAGSLAVTPAGGKAERVAAKPGMARYTAAGACVIRNNGSGDLHYVRVGFAGAGANETWGTAGLSPHYKLLLENRYARVYDIRIPAHRNEPRHTHRDRVVICLSGAKLKHLYPDGREEPSTLTTGEVAWRRGGTHVGQNLGDTDLWVIAVEPK